MRSLTLHFLVVILLSEACGVRWLGVPVLPDGLSGSSAPLLLANWTMEHYQMIEPWNIELWLVIAGAAWLAQSMSKQGEEFAWSRPRDIERRPASQHGIVVQSVPIPSAQDLIAGMTHEEWRARVFGKRPKTLLQMSTADYTSRTG